jgi:hypothetical protein
MVKHRSGTRWPDDQEVGWHHVRSAPCTRRRGVQVYWFDLNTKLDGLLVVWFQNNWVRFSGLGLKTGSYGLVIWASKSPWHFLGLGLKTKWATVCQLRHKIDGGWRRRGAHFGSTGLLRVEASWDRVSQSGLKTGGDVTRMLHVPSLLRLNRVEVEDGLCYPYFAVFIALGPRGILVV